MSKPDSETYVAVVDEVLHRLYHGTVAHCGLPASGCIWDFDRQEKARRLIDLLATRGLELVAKKEGSDD